MDSSCSCVQRWWRWVGIGVVVVAVGACSSPAASTDPGDGVGVDFGAADIKLDGKSDTAKPEDAPAGSDTTTDPANCAFPDSPAAGEPGAPCKAGADCQSGYCLEGANGKICTRPCVDCCPGGMKCAQVSAGADVALVCVPHMLALCRPCLSDAECAAVDKSALCIDRGDTDAGNDGKYCGAGCEDNADCPGGYQCKIVQGEKGAGKQCIPLSLTCSCSQTATLAGATTSCKVGNDYGLCSGTRKCGLDGLTLCDAPSPTEEACNGQDDNCDGLTDEAGAVGCKLWYGDADDDGAGGGTGLCLCAPDATHTHASGADCDDTDAAIHAGAAESCDGKDNNCDGKTDEAGAGGCLPYYADGDQDGFGGGTPACLCAADLAYPATSSTDCNDAAATTYPGAAETCDGVDNNCNGVTDEGGGGAGGCTPFYVDGDGDGWGGGAGACLCVASNVYTVAKGGDCDDGNPDVHPKTDETCNGVDDDCNGQTDEPGADGCKKWYVDADKDGAGSGAGVCLCVTDAAHTASTGGDCNDQNADMHPGAVELCNGVDDNCDGDTDGAGAADCTDWFPDADKDGFGGLGSTPKCQCKASASYPTAIGGDCNDASSAVFPGNAEVCDGLDNNCDGSTDPANTGGCQTWFADGDVDGYGSADGQCLCAKSGVYTTLLSGDCDDAAQSVHPGALEIPCNNVDDDCNAATADGGAGGTTLYYTDYDQDGFGDPATGVAACQPILGAVTNKGDCNDYQAAINPTASEVSCNSIDDNCNGVTDEGSASSLYYVDGDGDGYGAGTGTSFCTGAQPGGYVASNGDCNDVAKAINPGVAETCNGVDDNCNGQTDDGLQLTKFYPDKDGDGWGAAAGSIKACTAPPGYVSDAYSGNFDCDDTKAGVHPIGPFCFPPILGGCLGSAANEKLCDGLDNDCDGKVDDGLTKTYYRDLDGDGFGNPSVSQTICPPMPSGYVTDNTDCDDTVGTVHPGASELQCDNIDQDCTKYDACGVCSPSPVFDFESGSAGWSLGSGWRIASYNTPGQALVYNNSSGGYASTGGSTTTGSFVMPDGAVYLQFTVYYNNVDDDGFGTTYTDSAAAVSINVGGNIAKVGPSASVGTYTVKIPLDPNWKNTTQTISVTMKTGTYASYSGGFAVDSVQVVCQ